MKRVTSILAVLALASAANAADTVDMKWNAEMRTRYTSDNTYSGATSGANANTYNSFGQRNKLGLHLTKGENFQGHLTLINNFFWGSSNNHTYANFNAGPQDAVSATAGNNNLLVVNQAYGWWKANDMVSLKFGRSAMDIAGGFVSSDDDFLANPYSYDGVWTMWDFEPVTMNLFGLKLNDQNTAHNGTPLAGNSDPESIMYGLTVGFKSLPDMLKKAEIHLLQQADDNTTTVGAITGTNTKTEILRYGLYLGGDVSGFDYRAVADMYTGKFKTFANNTSVDYNMTGSMFDLGAGYSFPEMMMLRIGAVYHMDSGGEAPSATNGVKDFKSYKPGQYDMHNLGGTYLDTVSWGNLTYYSLSAGIKPMDDLMADLRWTKFSRTNDKDSVMVYSTAAGTATGGSGYESSNDIGSEIDLTLNKAYGDNFNIWALYGVFTPGDMVKNDNKNGSPTTKEENHTRIQIQGKLTF